MKRWAFMAGGWLLAVSAGAQFAGLPVADTAPAATGETRFSAGAVLGDDFNLFGGRILFAPIKGLALFADPGLLDPDGGDLGFAVQGGAKLTLPFKNKPVDVALRAAGSYAGFDVPGGDAKLNDFNAGVLVSRDIQFFSPYVFLGINYCDAQVNASGGAGGDAGEEDNADGETGGGDEEETDDSGRKVAKLAGGAGGSGSDEEYDVAAAAGLLLRFGKQFSLYAEIAYVDDLFAGAGARWQF